MNADDAAKLGAALVQLRDRVERLEDKVAEQGAEIVQLRAGHITEPWLDYKQLATHFTCSSRTVQWWKAEGMPTRLIDGKRKALLSQVLPWLAENGHNAYLPPGYGRGEVVPLERPAHDAGKGGSDVEAA